MSYSGIRNKKGISEKRASFGNEKSFSDVLKSLSTEDFSGGCFFGGFSEAPENACALSLNLESRGGAMITRKSHEIKAFEKALRRIKINDLLFGIDTGSIFPIGNASIRNSEGVFQITCNFFAEEGEEYKNPGVYIMKELSAGKYIFRLYLGTGVCPNIKIYENAGAVRFEGKPTVLTDNEGERYVQAEFEAQKNVRIDMTYTKGASLTLTHRFVRPMIIDVGTATALGADENTAKNTFFRGESAVIEEEVSIAEGETEADAFAGGRYIFKKGDCLYSADASSGECFLEAGSLGESGRCAIFRYSDGFLAVFENGCTVTLKDFAPGAESKKCFAYVPVHYLLYGDESEATGAKNEDINLFSEYFYARLFSGFGKNYILPNEACADGEFLEAYDASDMSLLPEGDVTATINENGEIVLSDNSACYEIIVKLRFRKNSEIYEKIKKFRALVFESLGGEVFQSVYEKGHNAVLYGGEKGTELAVFSLNEKMYAPGSKTLFIENTEKITSVLKYSENFLVFSPHYIRKMIVEESENGGFSISLKNFKYDIGCDIPKSAVCADDKIIYANSRAGVFYIDRFGFTERDMSRHVSANIEAGENGLLICPREDLLSAEGSVCDGKYYLRVGEYFYVWDFAKGLPTGAEKASDERKLAWFLYSGVPCKRLLGADEEKIYFVDEEGDFASLSRGYSLDSGEESYFRSRSYNLAPFGAASVYKLSISLAAKAACTVRLYFDGEEGNSKYTLTPEAEESTLCIVRPEARTCRRFAFSLHSFGAVRLEGVKIEYLPK